MFNTQRLRAFGRDHVGGNVMGHVAGVHKPHQRVCVAEAGRGAVPWVVLSDSPTHGCCLNEIAIARCF